MTEIVKEPWFVWSSSNPQEYEIMYWKTTMQRAYAHRNRYDEDTNEIKNPKAVAALRCDFCKAHPAYAHYESLSLYCENHKPQPDAKVPIAVGRQVDIFADTSDY